MRRLLTTLALAASMTSPVSADPSVYVLRMHQYGHLTTAVSQMACGKALQSMKHSRDALTHFDLLAVHMTYLQAFSKSFGYDYIDRHAKQRSWGWKKNGRSRYDVIQFCKWLRRHPVTAYTKALEEYVKTNKD